MSNVTPTNDDRLNGLPTLDEFPAIFHEARNGYFTVTVEPLGYPIGLVRPAKSGSGWEARCNSGDRAAETFETMQDAGDWVVSTYAEFISE